MAEKVTVSAQERIDSLSQWHATEAPTARNILQFSEDRVTASLDKIQTVLVEGHPQQAAEITHRIEEMRTMSPLPFSGSLQRNEDEVTSISSTPVRNPIVRTLVLLDARLGVPQYTLFLRPPARRNEREKSYIHYVTRFKSIADQEGFLPTDPVLQLIAISYVIQIARDLATEETSALLLRAKRLDKHTDNTKTFSFLDSIAEMVTRIKQHEAFIRLGSKVEEDTAQRVGFSPEQRQLLLDVAYASSKGTQQTADITTLLAPIIHFVMMMDWDKAYAHRDFLLRFLRNTFPLWRQKEFQEESQTISYGTIQDLAASVRAGKLSLPEEIPEAYRTYFPEKIASKIKQATLGERLRILHKSTALSTRILPFLIEGETAKVDYKDNKHMYRGLWSRTQHSSEHNFATELMRKIEASYRSDEEWQPPEKKAKHLSEIDQLISHLFKAYGSLRPKPAYTLPDYLAAILKEKERTHKNTVVRFIARIEERNSTS